MGVWKSAEEILQDDRLSSESADGIENASRSEVVRGSAMSAVSTGFHRVTGAPRVCASTPMQRRISSPRVTWLWCRSEQPVGSR